MPEILCIVKLFINVYVIPLILKNTVFYCLFSYGACIVNADGKKMHKKMCIAHRFLCIFGFVKKVLLIISTIQKIMGVV